MYKTYDSAIIMCKNMTTEARVNTANRFDPFFRRIQSFVLLVFAQFLFILYFDFFFFIKIMFSMKFSEFCVLPEFREFFLFSVSRKIGDSRLLWLLDSAPLAEYGERITLPGFVQDFKTILGKVFM